MEFQKCVSCGKRPAVVFITRMEGDKSFNEGLCLLCARELGIKPVDDILNKMGMNDEDIENMSGEVEGMLNAIEPVADNDAVTDGGAPAIDFQKLFSGFGFPMTPPPKRQGKGEAKSKKEAPKEDKKKL